MNPEAALRTTTLLIALNLMAANVAAADSKPKTMTEVLAASTPSDWRALDPERTLYLELSSGRVVIELAPQFAPRHVANIQTLVRERYFDGLAITRSQDNFVVQWGDPDSAKPLGKARKTLAAEFTRPSAGPGIHGAARSRHVRAADRLCRRVSRGARSRHGVAWLVHCYGMIGAGRDNDADSGGGAELYVVTGHAPRQLDRNITLIGRVLQGMELLSSLPRGSGPMGFYEKPEQRTSIQPIRLAADVPAAQRAHARSAAHGHANIHGSGRVASQSPRRVVQGSRRPHRRLQCTAAGAQGVGWACTALNPILARLLPDAVVWRAQRRRAAGASASIGFRLRSRENWLTIVVIRLDNVVKRRDSASAPRRQPNIWRRAGGVHAECYATKFRCMGRAARQPATLALPSFSSADFARPRSTQPRRRQSDRIGNVSRR